MTEVYFRKNGEPDSGGVWFRLNDGRVIDYRAMPSQTDRAWYVAATH